MTAVAVAVAILAATWAIGQRHGLNGIGGGGINQKLLLPKMGEMAPDFLALTGAQQPARLSDFRGKPVWLNFWGS